MRRKKYVSIIICAGLAALMAGCGDSSSSSQNQLSGIKKRVLISNQQANTVTIIDAQKDVRSTKALGVSSPTKMVTAAGITAILNSSSNQIEFIDNTLEQVTGPGGLQGVPVDIAISAKDGKVGYAAIRSAGVVEPVNSANGNILGGMPVPSASRLVEGPNEHKQLVFSQDPQNLGGGLKNAFFVVDTATNTAAPVTDPTGTFLDQPFSAVFDPSDANDTTAFILNCGQECGGVAASVAKVNFSNPAAPVFSGVAPILVAGATAGLLSGSTLFVAGTPTVSPAGCTLARCGSLQVINTGTLTAGAAVPITDGLHGKMALTSNNHLYIGAAGCTLGPVVASQVRGCLSVFNTGSGVSSTNPVFPLESSLRQNFDVTGMQPISGRNVIYVVQGGELDIFDFTVDALTATQIDIVGRAFDVVQIDP